MQPSPNGRRVGIRIVTFEACSGFTRVTTRRIAQPPKVTFVTRLQSRQLPSEATRQLPDLSTIIRVEPSSTGDSRLQGALPRMDQLCELRLRQLRSTLEWLVAGNSQRSIARSRYLRTILSTTGIRQQQTTSSRRASLSTSSERMSACLYAGPTAGPRREA